MTIQAAIRKLKCNPDLWARPMKWRGWRCAIALKGNRLMEVPTPRGGSPWTPSVDELLDNWEVVDPDVVLETYFDPFVR